MTPKKLREIADALEQGKEIQRQTTGGWSSTSVFEESGPFALRDFEFRVKPEPVELWVTRFNDGTWGQAFTREDNGAFPVDKNCATRVLFREVI